MTPRSARASSSSRSAAGSPRPAVGRRTRHAAPPLRGGLGSHGAGTAALGEPHERLPVPSGPGSPEGAKPSTPRPARRRRRPRDASRRSAGSRTTPPLPIRSRPTSNCGLTIARQSNRPAAHAEHRGQHLGQRDERHVDDDQVRRVGQRVGRQRAGVDALDHRHALVARAATVQLAVGDVERDDVRRAALEQAVGEAAGRGADVERATARDGDPERVERVGELDPAARDVAAAGGRRRSRRPRARAGPASRPAGAPRRGARRPR